MILFFVAIALAPVNVTCVEKTSRSFQVQWAFPPRDSWNGMITGSDVEITTVSNGEVQHKSVDGQTKMLRIEGLKPFSRYSVKVFLKNSVGNGPQSGAVAVQTMEEGLSSCFSIKAGSRNEYCFE